MSEKKPRIVFAFVEAGLGHIMPMKAISDAFEAKYGQSAEVVRTYFYQHKNNPDMKFVEDELVKEVKLHNKNKMRGRMQFFLMRFYGARRSIRFVMERRYKRGYQPALDYLKELDADVIFNTHFATIYSACEARSKGLIKSKVLAYCPDPVIGLQWDSRCDLIGISSSSGKEKAEKSAYFKKTKIVETPFLLRKEVENYNKGKEYYRKQLGLPEDNFTMLLADGAYGAGKLKETVYELLKTDKKLTIIAVCGKNEELYKELCGIKIPENITFAPYGFTDKTIMLAASCDLFIGKAGASNLAEPVYFGAPAIVTFRATPVEKWISAHFEKNGCAVRVENIKKAAKLALDFAGDPALMDKYKEACALQHRSDGPEIFADIIWDFIQNKK